MSCRFLGSRSPSLAPKGSRCSCRSTLSVYMDNDDEEAPTPRTRRRAQKMKSQNSRRDKDVQAWRDQKAKIQKARRVRVAARAAPRVVLRFAGASPAAAGAEVASSHSAEAAGAESTAELSAGRDVAAERARLAAELAQVAALKETARAALAAVKQREAALDERAAEQQRPGYEQAVKPAKRSRPPPSQPPRLALFPDAACAASVPAAGSQAIVAAAAPASQPGSSLSQLVPRASRQPVSQPAVPRRAASQAIVPAPVPIATSGAIVPARPGQSIALREVVSDGQRASNVHAAAAASCDPRQRLGLLAGRRAREQPERANCLLRAELGSHMLVGVDTEY